MTRDPKRSVEDEMEDEAGRMQQHLDELGERIDDAATKAKRASYDVGDEPLETVAGEASERTTSADDPTSAVGRPADAD